MSDSEKFIDFAKKHGIRAVVVENVPRDDQESKLVLYEPDSVIKVISEQDYSWYGHEGIIYSRLQKHEVMRILNHYKEIISSRSICVIPEQFSVMKVKFTASEDISDELSNSFRRKGYVLCQKFHSEKRT